MASQQQPQFRAKQLLDHLLQGRHSLADFTNVSLHTPHSVPVTSRTRFLATPIPLQAGMHA